MNFDDLGSETVAPELALITKSRRTATVELGLRNNYSSSVSEVVVLGKIPFAGNTYALNEQGLNSTYSVYMENTGIVVPEELVGIVDVYYSENEKPNKDLNDIENGWTKNPNDFSKVKTFLLVFNDYVLERDAAHYFTYNISIPAGVKYNEITYSHHGIYFSLDTEEGKYRTNIEPNKLGIMVARKFDLTINKFQEDTNKLIPGATYKVTEQGTEDSKTGTTDANGNIVINDLFAEKTYVIKEILSPDQYSLNPNEVIFTTVENEQGELEVNLVSGEVRDNITIAANEEGKDVVTVNVEDEVRPNINLIVSDLDTDQRIRGARYRITGKGLPEGGRLLKTNENGEASFVGLYLNEEYTLDELASEGYYLDEQVKFKIVNTNGVYSVEKVAGRIKEVTVVTNDEIPTMNINVQNEPIPRYTLNLNTIVKDQDVVLPGVEFKLVKGSKIIGRYTADENGMITIPDLFAYEAHRDLDQTYMLREITAPAGYAKLRDIKFRIVFDETNNVYTPVIEDGSVKETSVNGSTVTFVIENSPTFKLIKTDSSTGARLPGVKFEIYDVQTGLIARNGHGEFVGTLEDINGEMRYVVTTDENGQVVLDLPEGLYKAIEVYAPERFEFGDEEIRTHYFGIGMSKDETDATIVEVDKIESIPNSDYINGVEEIPTGGYYAVGTMYSPSILLENGQTLTKHPDIELTSLDASSYTDIPNISYEGNIERYSDAFIIKYNEDGSIAWASNEGSSYIEEYYDVAVTPDGGCIAVGYFYGEEITFSNGHYIYNEYEEPIAILVKYSATGQIEYVLDYRNYPIVSLDKAIVTTNGEYIVTGIYHVPSPSSTLDTDYSYGTPVMLKVNPLGQIEFIDELLYSYNSYEDLEKTPDGGWVVAGTFEYDFPFNNGDVAFSYNSYYNGFFAKYNSDGVAEWTKTINNAYINSIDQMTDGGYIVGGQMFGFVELEDGTEIVSNNYCDGLVMRYNKDIEFVEAKNIMRAQYTVINNVVATENNSYLVCANTMLGNFGDKSISNLRISSPSYFSIGFIEKYDRNENLIWDEYIYDVNFDEDEFLWSVNLFDAVKLNKCGDYIAAGNYFEGEYYGGEEYSISYAADIGNDIRYQMLNGVLIRIRPNAIPEKEIVEVGNSLKTFDITTNIRYTYNGPGGVIAGCDLNNGIISFPYEIVQYGGNNIKPIYCYPYEGYEIGEITINGVPQEFTPNEDGSYVLPQITNITEDMHIEVEFVVSTNKFTINKVDELTGEPLKDAEFRIEQIEERPAVNTEEVVGELTDNSNMFYATDESVLINDTIGTLENWTQTSTVIDESNDISEEVLGDIVANGNTTVNVDSTDIASEVLGELTGNNVNQTVVNYDKEITGVVGEPEAAIEGGYYFTKENGVYVPTNSATYQKANGGTQGIHSSEAVSYFPIDLTDYTGKYKVIVNAGSSCEENCDYGMFVVTETNNMDELNVPTYEITKITGNKSDSDYVSFTLEGGKVNYLFVSYGKDSSVDSGEDRITINSIKVYEGEEVTYNFVENEDGTFESTNKGVPATISSSYMTLDLTGKDGNEYYVYVNSYIYADYLDCGYITISETPDMQSGLEDYISRVTINGNSGETTKKLSVVGGKKYYIHFEYVKDGAVNGASDKFVINGISVNRKENVICQFVENENGGYESNNYGKTYVTASSYIPIDLTNHTGTYVVNLNGYVTGADSYGYGYGYATINQSTSRPYYSTSTGRFAYIYGTSDQATTANDYTYTLEGGSLYYLHLGYYTGYRPQANEKFVVNSIKVYGTNLQAYGFEQTADGKYVPTNIGVENSEAVARIPIDLTGYTGNYRVVVNAEVSSQSGYDFAFANIGTTSLFSTLNSYYGTRIMKVSGEKGATNYEYLMTGGSKYYLCFGYKKDGSISSGSDKVTINSINVYGTKEAYFNFKQNDDGSIESTNQGHNSTTANSYRIIDLTNYTGKYNLNMTYSISSQSTDYGYITITATETAPGAYDSGCLVRKSGTYSNRTYTHVLQGGSVYYLHFGYVKDSTTHEGDDKFTIHDISVTLNSSDLYYDYVRTNTSGKAITQLPFGKYQITEVVAPEGYNLLETPVIVEYRTVEDGDVTITNGQDGRVIVHHYLENTTESVYEDEIIKAPVGTEYSTMPKEATAEYDLLKDENGEYILPDNMTGTIINGVIEVTYYYDNISVPLRVNHLILGTNKKVLLQDGTEKETISSTGIEGETYTTSQLTSEELNEKYEIAEVPANAEGVFEYDDVVVNYYYKVKTFDVTTDVNGEGGTISGQDMESYENIEYGEDSTKEIVIEPEEDYYVEEVTVNNQPMMFSVRPNRSVVLNSFSAVTEDKDVIATFALTQGNVIVHHYKAIENEDGTLTYTEEKLTEDEVKTGDIGAMFATKESDLVPVYYEVCDSSEVTSGTYTEEDIEVTYYYKYKDFDYTVEYYYDGVKDDTKTEVKQETYSNVVDSYADKNIVGYTLEKVEGLPLTMSEVVENNVIKVFYVKDNFDYTVEYYYQGVKDDSKTVTGSELFGSEVITYEDKVIDGYKFERVENNPLMITEEPTNNVMKVYYVKDNFGYTVEYYYEGTRNDEQTVTNVAEFESEVVDYENKVIDGYRFDRVENNPLTITSNAANNVMKVYYVKDNFDYTIEYYYQGVKDDSKTVTSNEVFESEVVDYENKVIDGYKFEKVENNPLTITSNAENNVMKVYYVKDNFDYSIEYYYEGSLDSSKTVTGNTVFESEVVNYENKVIDGYKFEKVENNPLVITSDPANNIMKVYYVKDRYSYTTEYYYEGIKDDTKTDTNIAKFETEITNYTDKIIDGYKLDRVDNNPLKVQSNEANNVMKVYYVKDNFDYSIEYYYDGIKDDTQTVTLNAKFEEEITTYEDKVRFGYRLEKVDNNPLTITSNSANNVMKVYYIIDDTQTKELSYTVEYYKDGQKVDADTEVERVTVQVLEPDTMTVNKDKINLADKYLGYKTESVVIPDTVNSGDVIRVDYVLDDSQTKELSYTVEYYKDDVLVDADTQTKTQTVQVLEPDTLTVDKTDINVTDKYYGYKLDTKTIIPDTVNNGEVIKVYYVIDPSNTKVIEYITEIYKEDTERPEIIEGHKTVQVLEPDEVVYDKAAILIDNRYTGFSLETTEADLPNTVKNGDVVKVYYKKNIYNYTVNYYYDGILDDSKTDILTAKYNTEIETVEDKVIEGYKFQTTGPVPLIIGNVEATNIFEMFYVKDSFEYTVEYYYNGIKEDNATITSTALYQSEITTYEDKVRPGYKLERTENNPLIITADSVNNVMKVYYIIDDSNTKELSYTVEYYKDGVKVEADTQVETVTVQVLAPDTMTVDKTKINLADKYLGYKTENVVIPDTVNSGEVIRVDYVLDDSQTKELSYTVEYYKDGVKVESDTQVETQTVQILAPDVVAVDKAKINLADKYLGYKTENVVIPDTVNSGDVIRVDYVLDNVQTKELSYTVEYYKEGVKVESDTQVETITVQVLAPDTMTVDKAKINLADKYLGYKTENVVIPDTVNSGDVIRVDYVIDENQTKTLGYTVEYYKDGIKQETDTDNISIDVQILEPDTITVYKRAINTIDKYLGYKLDDTNTIIPDTVNNGEVIKVYYVIDASQTKELSYTVEYYKDGVKVDADTQVETVTVQILASNTVTVDKAKINLADKYLGYKTENVVIPDTVNSGDVIRVDYVLDDSQTKELSYTVEYYKDGVKVDADTQVETVTVQILAPNTVTVDKTKINLADKYLGYKTENVVIPDTVNSGDVIRVDYVLDNSQTKELSYTVEYYKDGVKVDADTQVETVTVQVLDPDIITVDKTKINLSDKYLGYKTENVVIPDTVENGAVIRVDYVVDETQTKELFYTVEYYKDGVLADTEVERITAQLLAPNTVTVDKTKINLADKYLGYKTENVVIPDTVNSGDVIRVDYVIDDSQTKELSYTVEYYKDGVLTDTQVETVTVQILAPDVITVDKTKINLTNKYPGYKTENVIIPDTVENGAVIRVDYVEDSAQTKELSYTVEYYKEGVLTDTEVEIVTVQVLDPDIITVDKTKINLTNKYYGYKTENVIIPDTVENGAVIRVDYVIDETQTKELFYTVEYYKDDVLVTTDTETETVTVQVLESEVITVNKDKINIIDKYAGYALDTEKTNIPDTVNSGESIKVYYKTNVFEYRVEYYFGNNIDDTLTVRNTANYGETITTYEDKVTAGYKLATVENLPLVVTENEETNVIKVYYVIDDGQTKELSYTVEYYKDDVLVDTETEIASVQVLDSDAITVNKDKINLTDKYEGYLFDRTEPEVIPDSVRTGTVIKVYYRVIPKVIVKYVDIITGEEVSEEIIIEGEYDESYDITEHLKEREGYTLLISPSLTGEFTNAVEEKVFSYAKNTEVIVKYLEKDTDVELLPEERIAGYEGKDYVSESKDVENYTYVESINAEGKMTVDPVTVVTHYYLQNSKVTVNYIDKNTEEVLDTVVFEGKVGDEFTAINKEFDNYVLVEAPENATVTLTKEEIVLNYYYLYVSEGLVEKHIDIVTGESLETISHEGKEGDEYFIDSKEFEGYDLVTNDRYFEKFIEDMFTDEEVEKLLKEYKVQTEEELFEQYRSELVLKVLTDKKLASNDTYIPENREGVLTKELIEVKYYYVRKSNVKVEYIDKTTGNSMTEVVEVDTDGDGINDSEEIRDVVVMISGHEEDKYETTAKEFEGYVLAKDKSGKDILPENAKGNMTKEDIIVRYYYVKVTKVTERHIDSVTNEYLEPEKVHDGYVGKEYDIKAKEFDGFVLMENKLPTNAKGEMTETEIIVEYYYIHKAKVTVEYIDKNTGEKILEVINVDIDGDGFADMPEEKDSTVVFEGYEGNPYKAVQKEFVDYVIVADKLPNNAEGTMTKEDIVVRYYYVHESKGVREEHIDIRTNKYLEDVKHYSGNEGDAYNIPSKQFNNYDVVTDRLPNNSKGKMTKDEIVVKYYYIKKAEVIVKYVDKESNAPVSTEDKLSGHDGDLYKTVPKDVPGYTVSVIPANAEGAMDGNNIIIVTFYYDKVKTPAPNNTNNNNNNNNNNNAQHVIISNTVTNNKPSNVVVNKDYGKDYSVVTPGTGDSTPIIIITILGITVVANIIYFINRKNKSKKDSNEEVKKDTK